MKSIKSYIPVMIVMLVFVALLATAYVYSFLCGLMTCFLLFFIAIAFYWQGRCAQQREINDKLLEAFSETNKKLGNLLAQEELMWGVIKTTSNEASETKDDDTPKEEESKEEE